MLDAVDGRFSLRAWRASCAGGSFLLAKAFAFASLATIVLFNEGASRYLSTEKPKTRRGPSEPCHARLR
ncbi:MAG TPA: hypothetical protein VLF15_10145, partial [Pseudoxanthomonas sp.]|nr:hypothetical protein [Pseudoxanthomonas sp.]